MAEEQKQRVLNYLGAHSTMVLSTIGPAGLWATPVFYVNRGFNLYFLSESTTRHSVNIMQGSEAAAAITGEHWDWRSIQGLQVRGQAGIVEGTGVKAKALALYCTKFPAVSQIFASPKGFKGVSAAKWHVLQIKNLRFTDNTVHFGERFEIDLTSWEEA